MRRQLIGLYLEESDLCRQLKIWSIRLIALLQGQIRDILSCRGKVANEDSGLEKLFERPLGEVLRFVMKPLELHMITQPVMNTLFEVMLGKTDDVIVECEQQSNGQSSETRLSMSSFLLNDNTDLLSQKVIGQTIVHPSVFLFIIETLGFCPPPVYNRALEDLFVLLVSNPRNTTLILSQSQWSKWLITLFDQCSVSVISRAVDRGGEPLSQDHELSSDISELEANMQGFAVKISLVALLIIHVLTTECDSVIVEDQIHQALSCMTFLATSMKVRVRESPRSLTPHHSGDPKDGWTDVRRGSGKSSRLTYSGDVARMVLHTVLSRMVQASPLTTMGIDDPSSLLWNNMLIFFDLIIDFIFHLNDDDIDERGGVLLSATETDTRVPDVILVNNVLRLLKGKLGKSSFDPSLFNHVEREAVEKNVKRLRQTVDDFSSIARYIELVNFPNDDLFILDEKSSKKVHRNSVKKKSGPTKNELDGKPSPLLIEIVTAVSNVICGRKFKSRGDHSFRMKLNAKLPGYGRKGKEDVPFMLYLMVESAVQGSKIIRQHSEGGGVEEVGVGSSDGITTIRRKQKQFSSMIATQFVHDAILKDKAQNM